MRATVRGTPWVFAVRHAIMFTSSDVVAATSSSDFLIPASASTLGLAPLPWITRASSCSANRSTSTSSCSMSTTSCPSRESSRAALVPTSPAPIITVRTAASFLPARGVTVPRRTRWPLYPRLLQRVGDELGDLRGVRRGPDAGPPERLALRLGGALAAGDYRARVAHRLALGGGEARDVGDDGGLHLFVYVLGGELLGVAPDLPDHHDAFGLGVSLEFLQDLDEVRPDYGVAADPDGGALPDNPEGKLVDDLVGERPASRDHADVAGCKDVARHDRDVGLLRREHAGAVRANERRVLHLEVIGYPHHVVDRDALGYAADGRELRVQRLEDGVGGEGRGDEDHARVRPGLLDGLLDRVEDRHALVLLSTLARRHPRDHVRTALEHPPRVEGALPARYALHQQPRLGVHEYGHLITALRPARARRPCAPLPASSSPWRRSPGCSPRESGVPPRRSSR